MYRLRCYCWAIVSGGRCSELRPIQQSCRAFTFALARLSCLIQWQSGDGGKNGGDAEKNGAVQGASGISRILGAAKLQSVSAADNDNPLNDLKN